MQCKVCDLELVFRWTDTHGVGACTNCGLPYTIYHYVDGKREDRPPECAVREEWIPHLRRYWNEQHRNCYPGAYNFPGSSYEVASAEDFNVFNDWIEAHCEELPSRNEDAPQENKESAATIA
jgi:transcription elongation factor Elf1